MDHIDMANRVYGRLTCVKPLRVKNRPLHWECKCECGNTVVVNGASIRNGNTASCGCLRSDISKIRATKHGMVGHPAHESYTCAKSRCNNPTHKDYNYYGGRGIKFLLPELAVFWKKMGDTWFTGATIDRIDNDGNYEISNIRWASRREQNLNTRRSVKIEFNGVTKNLCEWADDLGISYSTLRERLTKWDIQRALTTPKIY